MIHYRICESPDKRINLKRLLKWGKAECKKYGVPISNFVDDEVLVCKRKDFYAITDRFQHNRFKITVSTTAFERYKDNMFGWKNLILHELCHTIRGCYNHRHQWKSWVSKLNEQGYKISQYPYSIKKSSGFEC